MNFEIFVQKCKDNPAAFRSAVHILLCLGIDALGDDNFPAGTVGGKFVSAAAKEEAVAIAKELAKTDTIMVIAAIQRILPAVEADDLPPLHEYGDEEGICPLCGSSELVYGASDALRSTRPWKCPRCGATGEAGYDEVFDRHYRVRTKSGKAPEGRDEI